MLFNSLGFLYVFLPITYLVFWRVAGKTPRYVFLAISGYVFYSFWNYKFCSLMLLSTGVSYLAGLGLVRVLGEQADPAAAAEIGAHAGLAGPVSIAGGRS